MSQLEHPIIREAFDLMDRSGRYLEVASMADIPAGTGLGSSGSFTTALLRALYHLRKEPVAASAIAEGACRIEIDRLQEPIGKQDQYISAFGGVTCFRFNRDDTVSVAPLRCSEETIHNLEDNLLLFFTGYSRRASSILKEQDSRSRNDDADMTANLHFVKQIGTQSLTTLEAGNLLEFGRLMHEDCHIKRRAGAMTNEKVNIGTMSAPQTVRPAANWSGRVAAVS